MIVLVLYVPDETRYITFPVITQRNCGGREAESGSIQAFHSGRVYSSDRARLEV